MKKGRTVGLIIRKYRQSDQNELMSAWEAANALAHPFLEQSYVAQVRHDIPALYLPNGETWVAEINNHVVGFITLVGIEIGALFLQPGYHGKGVGRALMDKAQGLHETLEVEVFSDNVIGREFYRKYGFEYLEEIFHAPSDQKVLRLKYSVST